MRTDQVDPTFLQPQPKNAAVGRLVVEPSWLRSRTPRAKSLDGYLLKRRIDEHDFRRERWSNANSRRCAPAVCHHHGLCALSAFGFPDVGVRFFCGRERRGAHYLVPRQDSLLVEFLKDLPPSVEPHACVIPLLKLTPARRGRRVQRWKILPACTAAKHPQDPLEATAILDAFASILLRRLPLRDEGLDPRPLSASQFGCMPAHRNSPFDQPCSRKSLSSARIK